MYAFETLAIHAGEESDPTTGALTPPIHTSAAFKLPGFGPRLFAIDIVQCTIATKWQLISG